MSDTCKACGLPITGTRGETTHTLEHRDGTRTVAKDPGPYHYPACMPPIAWNHVRPVSVVRNV